MLQLLKINKIYQTGATSVQALKDVSISFRDKEFVAILGASGCGKTTLLNIIGGLDGYSSGDLIVDEVSTQKYKDRDWDTYRNNRIGFVFQSYNLIAHLSVLDNVQLAQQLSGVSAKQRKAKAIEVLTEVGLKDHVYKKPNQLSGGQMQRVAIARALVNDPEIILADEPTGALDTNTSVEIMNLLKRISEKKLIIMVTHNESLAVEYSTRIVQIKDGHIMSDSNEYVLQNTENRKIEKRRQVYMPYSSALKLSFNNLASKKMRTFLTSFAGSIGIIGIALVLAISNGFSLYLESAQQDMLMGMPITISESIRSRSIPDPNVFDKKDKSSIPPQVKAYDFAANKMHKNDITEEYVTYLKEMDSSLYTTLSFDYSMQTQVMHKNNDAYKMASGGEVGLKVLPDNENFMNQTYELVAGEQIGAKNEGVIIIDNQNRVSEQITKFLGFEEEVIDYTALLGQEVNFIDNDSYYTEQNDLMKPINEDQYPQAFDDSKEHSLKIVGIVRELNAPLEITGAMSSGIGYGEAMRDELLEKNYNSTITQKQLTDGKTKNIFTGKDFFERVDPRTNTTVSTDDQYKQNIGILGGTKVPNAIRIYPTTFETKDKVITYLDEYNTDRNEEQKIQYQDLAEMLSDTMNTMVGTASGVLIGVAAISLIVSSFMIGIITYVSVIERTKEIGILRSIGARKKDITRIFNAETILIGLVAGTLGIVCSWGLSEIINVIFEKALNFADSQVALLPEHAVALVLLSIALAFISGFIPAKMAAKKDPVKALRSE